MSRCILLISLLCSLTGAAFGLGLTGQRGRVRVDYFHLTDGDDGAPGGQLLGYGLRSSFLTLYRLLDGDLQLHVDVRAREDLARGDATRRELIEGYVSLNEAGRFSVTVGRQRFGEGFGLLLVDGGKVGVRYTDWLTHEVIGGLRARFDDLSPDRDGPTVGTGFELFLEQWVEAAASVTYSRERVAPTNRDALGELPRDVVTAAGRALSWPHPQIWAFLSAEVADVGAYEVPQDDPRLWELEEGGFTMTEAFAQLGYRPFRTLRLDTSYLFHTDHFEAPSEEARFQDWAARVRWRFWRRFGAMTRVRFQRRGRVDPVSDADGGLRLGQVNEDSVRLQMGLDLADIQESGFGIALSYMLDRGPNHDKQAVAAEAGYEGHGFFGYLGWRSVARERGDEFSSFTGGDEPDAVYPYSRAVSHAGYARGGYFLGSFFAQLTGDHDLTGGQTAAFAQAGLSWR